MREAGSAVVVTGAGAGIGRAVADHLTALGTEVIRLDRDAREGVRAFDVRDESAWDALSHEGVVGLVHAAGIRQRSPLAETSIESFDAVIDTNVRGTFLALRWAARRPHGAPPLSVVTLSSAVVDRLPEGQLPYNASKAAINVLTRGAARELAPRGIRVNAIAPGSILTAMTEDGWADDAHAARMRSEIPVARPGTPEEVASAAAFLLSEASSYMTGSVLTVDGGWTL
ncbi:SDR family oxidoreductase [Leucobacter rhizosphaerae]|uniref:SDR family oxidoreductase n=1 Tax=Leucobacter rhizosphaerae TaxID=2932245 RepID=A0ABY4FT54_9MICO|nr:SDR family NAD(P)-dependent oxidoreductase [Leucobacter rhizosphaerae]UOQ59479.1 SDR family oxidoreductase [Leucobacter rhizosphaerae]